jgi:hypothetical protein
MIKIIKLVNDHEIIGEVIDEASDHIVIGQPFSIHYMMSPKTDRPIIGLLRYMPFAKQRELSFKSRDIINSVEARDSMAGYYQTVVKNHVKYVDDNIDQELEQVAAEESADEEQADMSTSELMTTLLNNFNNDKMH